MIDSFDIRNSAFELRPVLANPPFNDSDWFRTAMREAQNPKQGRLTCRVWEDKDDDVRWQWREATWTTNGSPKGEHNQAHQYPSPQRGNANFAWVQHFIHHLAPHGVAGFVLVRFWFWMKHGRHKAPSRAETGSALSVFGEACRSAPVHL